MALSTYADLQASVAAWLHRTDLTQIIPDWIRMAESRANRSLKLRVMETEASLPFPPGGRTVGVPEGFVEPIAMWFQPDASATRSALVFVQPQDMSVSQAPGTPSYWTIDADTVALDRPMVSPLSIMTMRYRRAFSLSETDTTNWLLTNHPDIYLYGTLLESAPYIRDDARLSLWQDRFNAAMQEIQNKEGWSKSLAPLRTEVATVLSASSSASFYGV